jgi:hypothetical protein
MTKNGWLLFMIMALAVSAAGQNISKAIAEAGTSEDFPEASHLVVFDSIHNDVQESGLSYVNTHRLYKVLDKEGAKKLRVIKYDYDPLSA